MSFVVRKMVRAELDYAIDWAAREGWNPGLNDADPFWAADPGGFFLGELDGEVIGTVSAVAYGASYGFIGFFIVKPEFRGHRFGIELARVSVAHLGERSIGIDGVLQKEHQYRFLFGFEPVYRNVRFGGEIRIGEAPEGLTPIREVPFEQLATYDRRFFPAPRDAFLRAWFAMENGHGLALLEEGQVKGYGLIRQCGRGWKIGPLFADGPEVAESLFRGLCAATGGGEIFLDVPNINEAGVALADRYGMKEVFATTRMYKNGIPDLPVEGIFGVTTFEVG